MESPKHRILVVEDDADTCELLMVALTHNAYGLKTASTFSEASKLIETEDFSLLMLDSKLPDGSGLDLCRKVRKFNQHTPILFCSGLAYEDDKRAALEAGATAYFIKPVDLSELVESVEQLILSNGQST